MFSLTFVISYVLSNVCNFLCSLYTEVSEIFTFASITAFKRDQFQLKSVRAKVVNRARPKIACLQRYRNVLSQSCRFLAVVVLRVRRCYRWPMVGSSLSPNYGFFGIVVLRVRRYCQVSGFCAKFACHLFGAVAMLWVFVDAICLCIIVQLCNECFNLLVVGLVFTSQNIYVVKILYHSKSTCKCVECKIYIIIIIFVGTFFV